MSDEKIVKSLTDALTTMEDESIENKDKMTTQPSILVETAGGVLSPASASPDNSLTTHAKGVQSDDDDDGSDPLSWGWSTQADLYQPLGLPVVLVGDGRLGGISCTLSALESLAVRGYDVQGIVVVDDGGDMATSLPFASTLPLSRRVMCVDRSFPLLANPIR